MMYKNRQFNKILAALLITMGVLCTKLIVALQKISFIKSQSPSIITTNKNFKVTEKFGYGDILQLISKNIDFGVKTINMKSEEICNIQVDYNGDIKSLYSSLYSLNESENILSINSININKEEKTTTINIDFKKNK